MSTPTRPLLRVDANAFEALRDETAQITGLIPALIEKDYWVTEVLRAIVDPLSGADLVVFKGGTSLSKAYNIIERFSEDIDLVVSTSLTGNAQKRLLRSLGALVTNMTGLTSTREHEGRGFLNARFEYDQSSEVPFLKPGVLLEIGTRGGSSPCLDRTIESIMAANAEFVTPGSRLDYLDLDSFPVAVLAPQRTLAEKLAFLHHRACEGDYTALTAGARHLYDVAQLLRHDPTLDALQGGVVTELMIDIDSRSETAGWGFTPRPVGGFASSPAFSSDPSIQDALKSGYLAMRPLIWGEIPNFEDLISIVHTQASLI